MKTTILFLLLAISAQAQITTYKIYFPGEYQIVQADDTINTVMVNQRSLIFEVHAYEEPLELIVCTETTRKRLILYHQKDPVHFLNWENNDLIWKE